MKILKKTALEEVVLWTMTELRLIIPSKIMETIELSMIPSTKKELHDLIKTQDVVIENPVVKSTILEIMGKCYPFCYGRDFLYFFPTQRWIER